MMLRYLEWDEKAETWRQGSRVELFARYARYVWATWRHGESAYDYRSWLYVQGTECGLVALMPGVEF
ncbi:hypothetical protein [Bifidobacterium tissieri]|uniref:Uncharacterized protein n=1 Tax=Bifidobacterium tissieri TaxID=1630162 RepID=A0A5M9ZVJ3_9BIFI|nr:hypothetical protein [Bifidobacterium tissieri]KAA8828688.1 hypothetical protein EM849_11665 [Bifidobacterium tissieri]KAA8831631.1 hypothetical protein EMO89_02580 [Bifidobacterium tissieri]